MWHTFDEQDIRDKFDTSLRDGLSSAEAQRRLAEHGPNKLSEGKRRSLGLLIVEQLNNPLIYILMAAAVVSILLGEVPDAIIIFAVIGINAIVGVVQESKAEHAIEALKQMASPKALVRRDGRVAEISSESIVLGDTVVLETGRIAPCDIRLTESVNLRIEESALTGESVAVEKDALAGFTDSQIPLGDRINMAFASTVVSYGRGEGTAVATGMDTEIGKIAGMLESTEEEATPLQLKLARFGRGLGIAVVALCTVMFSVGALRSYLVHGGLPREDLFELFLTAVSLAVAAIPEGLPAIVTIVLAFGVMRMSRENAIVRKLPAVETLGSVSIICTDKTGTLTQNRMTVTRTFVPAVSDSPIKPEEFDPNGDASRRLVRSLVLCNDATWSEDGETGDPTETALLAFGGRFDIHKEHLEEELPRIGEVPFDSSRKMMSTVHEIPDDGSRLLAVKGALDSILPRCTHIMGRVGIREITEEDRARAYETAETLSSEALRILAAAERRLEPAPSDRSAGTEVEAAAGEATGVRAAAGVPELFDPEIEKELTFLGFIGMIDPPREEVKTSIATCRSSGITTVMITGDHKVTALAIARELSIARSEREVITGTELDSMSDREIEKQAAATRVFARVSPEHKVRIVSAFRALGNIVSMTGDGVNDAPSLKSADIGVAMGITGTDVAKGASDMVLTDDNFGTIVSAVAAGRTIYTNIKKTIEFLLSCNAGEIVAVFVAVLFGWPVPLRPTHILWVNLITDTFPALSLGLEKDEPDVTEHPPRDPKESIFAGGTGRRIVANGLLVGALTLGVFFLARRLYPEDLEHARTMAFGVLSFSQLVHAFDVRHAVKSLFTLGPFGNPYLVGSLAFGVLLQVALIMTPPVARFFSVTPLRLVDWGIVAAFSILPFIVNEIAKLIRRLLRSG
jgi:P-type Ca2+ transporter type 2C